MYINLYTPYFTFNTNVHSVGGLPIFIYTHLESYIRDLYKMLSINDPRQLDIEKIASMLNINVYYGTSNYRVGNNVILKKSTKQREWQMFAHELCHCLRHVGNQLNMHYLFVDLQEYQADHFAYHFCVPTFMLANLREVSVDIITRLFNVEYDFALRRLEMYQSKILSKGVHA